MIRESQIPIMRGDGVEKLQVLDFPMPTPSEVIQFMRDSWGINNDRAIWVLMSRITQMLDESSVGGEDGERQYAVGEHCGIDGRWQGAAEKCPRVRVDPGDIDINIDDSSTIWSEYSDARSMCYSVYTDRSVTSFKRQPNQLVWRRNETREMG